VNKQQKADLEAQAQHIAGVEAKKIAEDYAIKFVQQFCADLSNVRGQTYILSPEKFSDVFTTVQGVVFDAAAERLFEEKHEALLRGAKIEATNERQRRRMEREEEAWRREAEAEVIAHTCTMDECAVGAEGLLDEMANEHHGAIQ
jgi:hypothetical protein